MNKQQFEYLSKNAHEAIIGAKRVFVAMHENPDGDAISSSCALISWLEMQRKPYYAYCASELPASFDYLPYFLKISNSIPRNGLDDFDVIILADCAEAKRSGLGNDLARLHHKQVFISFDHHPQIKNEADIDLRDDKAASTTEVLYDFFQVNRVLIDKNIANCILTGILTDTANFLYPSTSEKTIKIAAELLTHGANLYQIVKSAWQNKSLEAIKVWGTALLNLQINDKYNIAYSVITKDDLAGLDDKEAELDGIAGFLSNLYGVKAIMFLHEQKNGKIRGSLRTTRKDVDVSKLARYLGGGGHIKASGFKVDGLLVQNLDGWQIL